MYTIQCLDAPGTFVERALQQTLNDTMTQDGRFRVISQRWGHSTMTRKERKEAGTEAWEYNTLYLQKIRLTSAKPYCGNHPGPCLIGPGGPRHKPNTVFLEWDDWVQFHNLINGVCDQLQLRANIWTRPRDAHGKFWIRKDLTARVKWDYTEEGRGKPPYVSIIRVWNTGTPDQFTT
jgi:hypothetical protein